MYDKHSKILMEKALAIDEDLSEKKVQTIVETVIETSAEDVIKELCVIISHIVDDNPENKELLIKCNELKNALIYFLGHLQIEKICEKTDKSENVGEKNLMQLLSELDALIGLTSVKEKVRDLIAYQKVQHLREQNGLFSEKNTMHLAFTGNPGTGKTTVARIVGQVYKQIGLLSKGHFIEVSRTDLIAGYQGQTALKVKDVITRARGGVLFIDEAYSITENEHSDSYGRECLTELTKALEDYRDDLVVIVAGYTEPMKKFFDSNPGLKSRFNTFIEFGDYDAKELEEIFLLMCKRNNYSPDNNAINTINKIINDAEASKSSEFANARFIRNMYEDVTMNHARRVAKISSPTVEDLVTIKEQDICLPNQTTEV